MERSIAIKTIQENNFPERGGYNFERKSIFREVGDFKRTEKRAKKNSREYSGGAMRNSREYNGEQKGKFSDSRKKVVIQGMSFFGCAAEEKTQVEILLNF